MDLNLNKFNIIVHCSKIFVCLDLIKFILFYLILDYERDTLEYN